MNKDFETEIETDQQELETPQKPARKKKAVPVAVRKGNVTVYRSGKELEKALDNGYVEV